MATMFLMPLCPPSCSVIATKYTLQDYNQEDLKQIAHSRKNESVVQQTNAKVLFNGEAQMVFYA